MMFSADLVVVGAANFFSLPACLCWPRLPCLAQRICRLCHQRPHREKRTRRCTSCRRCGEEVASEKCSGDCLLVAFGRKRAIWCAQFVGLPAPTFVLLPSVPTRREQFGRNWSTTNRSLSRFPLHLHWLYLGCLKSERTVVLKGEREYDTTAVSSLGWCVFVCILSPSCQEGARFLAQRLKQTFCARYLGQGKSFALRKGQTHHFVRSIFFACERSHEGRTPLMSPH